MLDGIKKTGDDALEVEPMRETARRGARRVHGEGVATAQGDPPSGLVPPVGRPLPASLRLPSEWYPTGP